MATGYGTDSYCYDVLRAGRLVSGAELVAQALFRRLITPRGTLRDGAEGETYGFDVQEFIGQVGTQAAIDAVPDIVVAEVLKDDRIDTVAVSASKTQDSRGLVTIVLNIDATLRDPADSFTLTISVSDVSVQLLGIDVS